MQVFKTYFKILKKQKRPIIIYAVMFLCMIVLLTANTKVANNKFVTTKVHVMVVNEDGDNKFIDGFIDYLGQYVTFEKVKEDKEARKDDLFFRKVDYILTIPKGFTESFVGNRKTSLIKDDVPGSMEAISVDNVINNYLNMAMVYLKNVPGISYEELASNVTNNLSVQTEVHIDSKTKDALASSNSFNVDYFNVLGFVIIASLITGVSVVMFSFHGLDIRRRHTASPITIRNMNFQLILANLVYALSLLLLYVVFGYLQNENRIVNTNTWLTWINAVVFTVTCLSISYLVGITVNSRKTVQAISTALSLGLAFLSGMFVPQQYLGDTVLKIASFTPSFWYVKANNTIGNITTFHWSDIGQIIGYMAIQLGFAIAIISIALVVSKRKTQQTT